MRAFLPDFAATPLISRNPLILETPKSMLCDSASSKSEPGETSQARIGASIPFSRKVIASSSSATPSHDAPALSAARATRINP